jgi:RNA polymerase sigma factor (sigma-70 family)
MVNRSADVVWDQIRKLVPPSVAGVTDKQLLERFTGQRDESAFAVLLRRHGATVLGVARRVLGPRPETEDVFQATFLTLARRASAIRNAGALSCWLHGVAFRLALRVRAETLRREARPAPQTARRSEDPLEAVTVRDLCAAVDEELRLLPEKYRGPLLLCLMEDRTQEEAAQVLGCPLGTLRSRLERGRQRLKARLARRGLAVPLGLATMVSFDGVRAAPATLVTRTVRAAVSFALREAPASGTVSAYALTLAEGMVRVLLASQGKPAIALVLALGLIGAGAATLLAHHAKEEGLPAASPALPPVAAPRPEPPVNGLDQRGDALPPGALARLGSIRLRHGDDVYFLEFAADGKTVFSGGSNLPIRAWEVATGKEIGQFGTQPSLPGRSSRRSWGHAFSPDGRFLAASFRYGQRVGGGTKPASKTFNEFHVWDAATAKEVGRFWEKSDDVPHLRFSADGRLLATAENDGIIRLWDTASVKLLRRLDHPGIPRAFSPDGKVLATADAQGNRICLWETATGKELHTLAGNGPLDKVVYWSLAFTPDGKGLLTRKLAGDAALWDVATAKELRRFPGGGGGGGLFSPDGRIIAVPVLARTGSRSAIVFWEPSTGKELGRLENDWGSLAFSPDGQTLAVSHSTAVRLYRVLTWKELHRFEFTESISRITFSPDGRTLATAGRDQLVRLWEVATGKERLPLSGHPTAVSVMAVSPDGRTVASASTGDFPIRLWEPSTGKELHALPGHGKPDQKASGVAPGTYALAFSPDGRTLASVGGDRTTRLWKVATGREERQLPFSGAGLAFSPDGRTLVVGEFGKLHLVDLATAKEVRQLDGCPPVAFSPDGRGLFSRGRDHRVLQLWQTDTGRKLWESQQQGGVVGWDRENERLALSADGRSRAVGHETEDRAAWAVSLWDVAAQRKRGEVPVAGKFSAVALSPDGRTLAVGEDQGIHLWETVSGKERGWLRGHRGEVRCLAFTADGRSLISASADTTLLVWDMTRSSRERRPLPGPLTAQDLEARWAELAGADAARAHRALWTLAADPIRSVPFLGKALEPYEKPDAQLERMIADLDHVRFEVRQKAVADLEKVLGRAEPALRKVLAGKPPLELHKRVTKLVEKLESSPVPPSDLLCALRALEVLEHAATPEAKRTLAKLAKGPEDSRLTREAMVALERLEKRAPSR